MKASDLLVQGRSIAAKKTEEKSRNPSQPTEVKKDKETFSRMRNSTPTTKSHGEKLSEKVPAASAQHAVKADTEREKYLKERDAYMKAYKEAEEELADYSDLNLYAKEKMNHIRNFELTPEMDWMRLPGQQQAPQSEPEPSTSKKKTP